MKKVLLGCCIVLALAGISMGGLLGEAPGELNVYGLYWFPGDGDFDLFENGYGIAVSYREWFDCAWLGMGVNLGLAQWDVDSGSNAYKYNMLSDYDGDAMLIPFGLSLYFSVIDWDNWSVIVDTGVQYVFVDSSVDVFNSEAGVNRRVDVDIDDAVLWNIGAEFEYMLTENAYVTVGGGYQVDVVKSDTEYMGRSLRDTNFQGAYLKLGAKFLF